MTATPDLNDVITSAVKARVEASVLEALSGDEYFGQMVQAALTATVEVKDPRDSYRTIRVPFLSQLINSTLQEAIKDATRRLVEEQRPKIEKAVRAELTRSTDAIAKQLVGAVSEAARNTYGITVDLKYPGR